MTTYMVTTVKIRLPFGLRWLKRFVRLETERIKTPDNIIGEHLDAVIIDEIADYKPNVKLGGVN